MNIPSDFDPLAWDERRYIQPVIKGMGYEDAGVTNESYPYTFKMEVDGTSTNGVRVWHAFDTDTTTRWGAYGAADIYAIMTFEYPLRIVGLQMLPEMMHQFRPTFKLYGISEGEDPVTEGTKLGQFNPSSIGQYQCLATANRDYYRQYRIDFHCILSWNTIGDIRLDAYYRPADL